MTDPFADNGPDERLSSFPHRHLPPTIDLSYDDQIRNLTLAIPLDASKDQAAAAIDAFLTLVDRVRQRVQHPDDGSSPRWPLSPPTAP